MNENGKVNQGLIIAVIIVIVIAVWFIFARSAETPVTGVPQVVEELTDEVVEEGQSEKDEVEANEDDTIEL